MIKTASDVKQISAPHLATGSHASCFSKLDGISNDYQIGHLLWCSPEVKPDVSFKIGYSDEAIILKYTVTEPHIKAEYQRINDPVYKDSCVEFFIGFDEGDANYYNLEFNRLGTPLGGFGSDRYDRQPIPVKAFSGLKSQYDLYHDGKTGLYTWQLALSLPFSLFVHHDIDSLHNKTCRCNFFKCGDDLPDLHFMSWSPIDQPEPDFHLPHYFGSVKFEPANNSVVADI